MKYLSFFLVFSLVSGCSSFTAPARKHELDSSKSYWMDYDPTRRGTIVASDSSKWKSCAEPSPDAGISIIGKLEGSLDVASKGKAEGKGELDQKLVSLAEKTQMVLFLRESLFRLCELSINTDIPEKEITGLYKTVIDSSIVLVKTEIAQIELDKKRLESANSAEKIYKYLNEKDVDPKIIEGLLKGM